MCAAVTTTALGVGISGFQAYQGMKDKKKAENELNNYERQALTNAFENVKISTVGTDLMREESQRNSADLVDASRNAGIRGILGGIPKIQSNANAVNRQIQADLDNQVIKKEYAIAGDETALRNIKEDRDNANIAALSSQIQKGEADMWNGISGVAKGIQYGANNIDFKGDASGGREALTSMEGNQAGVTTAGKNIPLTTGTLVGGPKTPNYGSTSQNVDVAGQTSTEYLHRKPNNFLTF